APARASCKTVGRSGGLDCAESSMTNVIKRAIKLALSEAEWVLLRRAIYSPTALAAVHTLQQPRRLFDGGSGIATFHRLGEAVDDDVLGGRLRGLQVRRTGIPLVSPVVDDI